MYRKVFLALCASTFALSAYAQGNIAQSNDMTDTDSAYQAATSEVSSQNLKHWQVRLRGIWVSPQLSSTEIQAAPVKADKVSNDTVPELDINYYFTPHISTELILATTKHKVTGSNGLNMGSVRLLPPTLTVLYHFIPNRMVSPYAGAGLNYTVFYSAKSGSLKDVKYDNAVGFALQAGVDIKIAHDVSANLDVKKLFLNTNVHANVGTGMNQTMHVTLNPWIIGVGVGYRF